MPRSLRSTVFALALLVPAAAMADPPRGADLEPPAPPSAPELPADIAPVPRYVDFGPSRGTPSVATRIASQTRSYLRAMQREAFPSYVAGSPGYFAPAAHEAERAWHPAPTEAPGIGQTVLNNFVASPDVSMAAMRHSMGSMASPQMMAASASLDAAHPNSPMLQPRNLGSSIAEATARRTRVVLRVDQDDHGHLLAVDVEASSLSREFDARATEAVRAALATLPPRPMPGGWRSYWELVVVDSRDPLIVALPGLPGDPPVPTPAYIEVTDDGQVHAPLMTHRRRRVRLLGSERLDRI